MADDISSAFGTALKVAPELAVLIITLEGDGPITDSAIAHVLRSKELQSAVEGELKRLADANLKSSKGDAPKAVSGSESLKQLAGGTLEGLRSASATEAGRSHEASELKALGRGIEQWFRGTPTGVWIDRNKNILYIVAAGLAVGGAVSAYMTRAGDEVVAPVMSFAGKQLQQIEIGKFTLGVNKFVPSTRTFEVKAAYADKWERVKTDFSLTVKAVDREVASVDAKGTVLIPLASGMNLQMRAEATLRDEKHLDCVVGMTLDDTRRNLKLDLVAKVKDEKFDSVALTGRQGFMAGPAKLEGTLTASVSGTGEYRALLGLSIAY